ncbi:MAG: hypothetical protein ACRDAM_15285 [Casimicrobium sp.]
METIKVKAWGDAQGDFVLINKSDFDEEKHELFSIESSNEPGDREKLFAALDAKSIPYKKTMGVERLKALLEG